MSCIGINLETGEDSCFVAILFLTGFDISFTGIFVGILSLMHIPDQ